MSGTPQQQPDTGAGQQPAFLERYRQRYRWLDHLIRAAQTYTRNNGDHYAAAITYFSVLSLVPLMMIAFAGFGFVLAGDQQLLDELQRQIRMAAPPGISDLLNQIVQEAIDSRGSIGIIGLLVALYSGLGWMSNLREALTAIWEQHHEPAGFLRAKLADLLRLLGLGAALLVSFALTGAGTAFGKVVLNFAGLGQLFWARMTFYLLVLVVSLASTWLVFLWVIARLPREPVPLRSAMRAAVLAAIGFELLKQAFAFYLGSVGASPTGRIFGPVIGLMVFAYFVSRFLLFITAWAATDSAKHQQPAASPSGVRPQVMAEPSG